MVKCKRCGANCDTGEVIAGICIDCAEEERLRQIRASEVLKMMDSPSYQMEFGDILEVSR